MMIQLGCFSWRSQSFRMRESGKKKVSLILMQVYLSCSHIYVLNSDLLQCQTSHCASAWWICPLSGVVFVLVCIIHLDSSRGCCTVRRRGWRSRVSCWTPLFSESMIWSFSNFWYLSTIFLSNTNTATSWREEKDDSEWAIFKAYLPSFNMMRTA